jgi:wyosine [tRNA(Phe)-imidazoG37] synthetase (radical SAM superfamily)
VGTITGGPVCTRFAKGALCVSFLPPGCRICSFDCTYCAFEPGERLEGWPSPGAIGSATLSALGRGEPYEAIAIAGPGEQTLHPRFGMAVAEVLAARRLRPELPVRVHTNGTTLRRGAVKRALELVDERVVRIDAGGERVSRSRPTAPLGGVVAALTSLTDFAAESVFVDGSKANADANSIDQWVQLLAELRPSRVYVTTLEGEPVEPGPRPISSARLEDIAEWVRSEIGVPTVVVA